MCEDIELGDAPVELQVSGEVEDVGLVHGSPDETEQQDLHPATLEQTNAVVEVQLAVSWNHLRPADDVMQLLLAQVENGRDDDRLRVRLRTVMAALTRLRVDSQQVLDQRMFLERKVVSYLNLISSKVNRMAKNEDL